MRRPPEARNAVRWEKDKDAFGRECWRATGDSGRKWAILPTRTGHALSSDSNPVDSGRENGRFTKMSDAMRVAEDRDRDAVVDQRLEAAGF